jgi:hypothetical protein
VTGTASEIGSRILDIEKLYSRKAIERDFGKTRKQGETIRPFGYMPGSIYSNPQWGR